jgi:nitrite reductase/ring-hydroxylating ferredoxin subunit
MATRKTRAEASPEFLRGKPIPPQGQAGGYDQNWYPICLSREVANGQIHGSEFLNGRVIVVRDPSGKAQVLSAYCRHVGADLSGGDFINGQVVCPFHKWGYDMSGQCVSTLTGDAPPENARLFRFPTHEGFGLIWAFNGLKPLYDPPSLEISEEEVDYLTEFDYVVDVDHFIPFSNSSDIQHLRAVHKIELDVAPEDIERWEGRMRYKQDMTVPGMPKMTQVVNIFGTNCLTFETIMMGRRVFQMSAGKAIPGNRTIASMMSATPKSTGAPGEAEMVQAILQQGMAFGRQLFAEDDPIMRRIRFRQDTLTQTDRMLMSFLKYVREYPRTDIACDMIA